MQDGVAGVASHVEKSISIRKREVDLLLAMSSRGWRVDGFRFFLH